MNNLVLVTLLFHIDNNIPSIPLH